MNDLERIEQVLHAARRRRRGQQFLNGLATGALAGGIVLVTALAAYKLLPVPAAIIPTAAGTGLALALAMALRRAWTPEPLSQTARWIDDREQLRERLSTALELGRDPATTASGSAANAGAAWPQLVLADAARHAEALQVRSLTRFTFPRAARPALLALALAAGLGFVPEYRTAAQRQRAADAVLVQDVGTNLAGLVRRELAQRPPALPAVERSLTDVAALGEQLGRQQLTKAEALRDLASTAEKLSRQEQQLEQNPALRKLEQAARQPGSPNAGANASATPESLKKQIEDLQKSLGQAADKEKQLDQLARDLQKLQQQAASAASGQNDAASAAARQQMAQSLADIARQAAAAGVSLDGLNEAIEALEGQQIDQFVKDLNHASHDLEQLRDAAKDLQQLQQQMSRLGKDLAEQLKFGQAQAASQTLERMIQDLKSGNVSPEQMEKLLQELQQASKPGAEYGQVGDLLQKAAQQAKSGDKPGAAKNLAAAKDELQKLLEQMKDSEGLQSALAAVERAQSALSNNQRWSQVNPSGQCKSCNGAGCARCNGTGRRWGHGGRPGSGVGTWAEDQYGWTYFDQAQSSGDNSGIQRPDLDPKGLTDRPADLNPNLMPDKVKGRISPGGSMPSITLKGVSIKGSSNVKFEEAATAAQEDAQSALNQDRVPRAYQNAVRDYFDDLKK